MTVKQQLYFHRPRAQFNFLPGTKKAERPSGGKFKFSFSASGGKLTFSLIMGGNRLQTSQIDANKGPVNLNSTGNEVVAHLRQV